MPYSVGYEVQVSSVLPGEDFVQVSQSSFSCEIPVVYSKDKCHVYTWYLFVYIIISEHF